MYTINDGPPTLEMSMSASNLNNQCFAQSKFTKFRSSLIVSLTILIPAACLFIKRFGSFEFVDTTLQILELIAYSAAPWIGIFCLWHKHTSKSKRGKVIGTLLLAPIALYTLPVMLIIILMAPDYLKGGRQIKTLVQSSPDSGNWEFKIYKTKWDDPPGFRFDKYRERLLFLGIVKQSFWIGSWKVPERKPPALSPTASKAN